MEILLDLRFKRFLTTKVVSVVYLLWMLACVLSGVCCVIVGALAAVRDGPLYLFGGVIVTLVAVPLLVVLGRIYLEVIVVLFRIAENIQAYADREGLTAIKPVSRLR